MLDARLQSRLTQNYTDAATGYANASMAAFSAAADRAMAFWSLALPGKPEPAGRRDHLSWYHGGSPARAPASFDVFDPWAGFNAWTTAVSSAMQPKAAAPGMMFMAMAFTPFAAWWGNALKAPNFAWPMAYSMIASGVPESVAWPTAEANAAVMDATGSVTREVQHAFSSYQSAGGYATAHIWPPKVPPVLATMAMFTPFAALWPVIGTQVTG